MIYVVFGLLAFLGVFLRAKVESYYDINQIINDLQSQQNEWKEMNGNNKSLMNSLNNLNMSVIGRSRKPIDK